MNKNFLVTLCIILSSLGALKSRAEDPLYGDPLQDVTIVGAATAFGAVLGLSTLPFTEEPGDHMKNVLVGGAIGLILGVGWVAYSQAQTTNEGYSFVPGPTRDFLGAERGRLASKFDHSKDVMGLSRHKPSSMVYSFSF